MVAMLQEQKEKVEDAERQAKELARIEEQHEELLDVLRKNGYKTRGWSWLRDLDEELQARGRGGNVEAVQLTKLILENAQKLHNILTPSEDTAITGE